MNSSSARSLQLLGRLEGLSLLVLLFVAVPLKYGWDMPAATRLVGAVHGVLYVGYGLRLAQLTVERSVSRQWCLQCLGMAAVPFGFLWVERRFVNPVSPIGATGDGS